ncbi:MAG: caspase family protein [Burkholderiales bacterium]|nr:caspase family protein [Burkholderiales bacterium]
MHSLAKTLRLLLALCGVTALPLLAAAQAADSAAAAGARRIALVIGNNGYDSAPLVNSVNDARAMAGVLREAGFAVMLLTDVDQRQFQLALREFGERLKAAGSGGAGLFYYAGHGMQIRGRNFLIPVRSNIAHEDEVAYTAVDAQSVLDKMESAGSGTNIVILDACRNNPFARSFRSSQQGLAQMDAPVGTLVAYATAPGAVAIDSVRGLSNGLYTTHLLEAIRRPGLKVEDVLKQTRNAVLRASGNKQMPWEASALVGDFYFHPPHSQREGTPAAMATPAPPAPAAAALDAQTVIDDALWDAVKDSRNSAELFAYLNRFPMGRHAREARRRLLDLAQPGGGGASTGTSASFTPPAPGPADNLPLPPPRTGLAAGMGQPAERDSVEEAVRWGTTGGDRRPAQPRRNAPGFAEGDRFRYQKTDFFGTGSVTDYIWHVDRIDGDGSLWVNGGRQRLDPMGQRRGGNDEHTGTWIDLSPPLPLLEVAQRGAGTALAFSTTVRIRDASDQIEMAALSGTLRTSADSVRGPRGMPDLLPAVKVEVELMGTARRSDGAMRALNWKHTYWMSLPLLMPVAMEIVEIADGLPRQSTRHELIAIDQMSLAEPAAAAAPGGVSR